MAPNKASSSIIGKDPSRIKKNLVEPSNSYGSSGSSLSPVSSDEETGCSKDDKQFNKVSSADSGIGSSEPESLSSESSGSDGEGSSLPSLSDENPNLTNGLEVELLNIQDEGYVGSQEEIIRDVTDAPRDVTSTDVNSYEEPMEGGSQDVIEDGFVMVPSIPPVQEPEVPIPAPVVATSITELHLPNLLVSNMVLFLKFAMHRFFTFPSNWSFSISREDLANSGFFLTHEKDAIQCYFCKLTVSDSQISANVTCVDDKHKELNPNCPFMNGMDDSNIPINDPTNYRYEAHRLYSLLTTPWNAPVTPYDLAKFGFYWTGSGDNCRCAFCRLEVRGWEDGDTAESEHRRWNPNCVFINRRSVGNVPIGQEASESGIAHDEAGSRSIASSFSINPFAKSELSHYGQIKYTVKSGPRAPVETLGVTPLNPARHHDYVSLASRINSYKTWPMSLPQRPEQLADAGFYYTGAGDRVICFQCGGGLKDWAATDTPWSEHAKWFSRCPYLLLKKGKAYVDAVHLEQKIEMPIGDLLQAAKNSQNNKDDEMEVEEKEVVEQESSGSLLCKLCGLKDIETVFLPCGHMVTCMDCVEKEANCRKCKKPRVAYVRTFLQ